MTSNTAPAKQSKARNLRPYIVSFVLLLLAAAVYAITVNRFPPETTGSLEPSEESQDETALGADKSSLVPMETALEARGVYLTFMAAGTPSKMTQIMEYVRSTPGINAMVVDLKDNNGCIPFAGPEEIPSKAVSFRHFPGLIRVLKDEGYFMIARIVVFQDPFMAEYAPEQAIRNPDGSLWKDNDGRLWLNPYDKRNWEFTKDLALWACDMGFDEIQLDYVRFPDGARGLESSNVLMPGKEDYASRGDCIADFLDYMSEALEDKAYLSADIFGFTTIAQDDMGIGQKIEQVADHVDFICPMVYPSHYFNKGIYGFDVPEAHPGEVVYKAMEEAIQRTDGLRAKIRPWLQDFSLRIHYGSEEVQAQIDAVFEHGINTFLMWNPANVYTNGVDYSGSGSE
jgi:hypothetical protein